MHYRNNVAKKNYSLHDSHLSPTDRRDSRKQTSRNRTRKSSSPESYPIIVHSHLCWDWVWQRPQQFLSRLSNNHQILFVETIGPDPQLSSPTARFWTPENSPNVTILRLQFPSWRWSDGKFVDRERRRLVKEFLGGPGSGHFENPVQWFYDPMAVPAFLGQMDEIAVVYDCMDELSKFREAPPEIKLRENELLAHADVVFAGGRKLWESKKLFNDNCHFYGCGVDVSHFGQACDPKTKIPADIASLRDELEAGTHLFAYRLEPAEVTRLAAFRDALQKQQTASGGRGGALTISLAPEVCRGGELTAGPVLFTTYLRTAETAGYVPLARDVDMRSIARGRDLTAQMPECGPSR